MKCHDCGIEEPLPFTCPYCGQQFCIDHRLPENHNCSQSPERAPLGAALTHKNPWSLTQPRHRVESKTPPANNEKNINTPKKTDEFLSEGGLHFVRNPEHKPRKKLKRAAKIILSLAIIAVLGYCLWLASPSITQSFIQQPAPTSNPTTSPIEIPTQTPTQTPEAALPQNTDSEIETQIFQLINTERQNRGLPALQNDTSLTAIAKSWCLQMAETQNLAHGDFTSRLQSNGIYTYGFQYGEILESYGSTSGSSSALARIFVDGWLGSQGHREIMLTELSGYMGVGVSRNGSMLYSVVDFAFSLPS